MSRSEEILRFWFGDLREGRPVPAERHRLWFGGGEKVDRLIRGRFARDVDRAAAGDYDHWAEESRGRLAMLVLLDQFSRNIYRGTAQAYARDARAQRLALEGLDRGQDRSLFTVERAFFYLPLEHAEDLKLQERSVALFRRLAEEAPPALKEVTAGFLDYALRHRDIITRFGRFPHRNETLGRGSTPEEEEFLRQPGSSF